MPKKQEKKPDYRIYPIRKEDEFNKIDRELPPPFSTMLEKGGANIAIFAPPGSGKSNVISNWLLSDSYFKDLFDAGLYYISPTAESDLTSVHLRKYADFVETQYSEALLGGIFDNIMSIPAGDRAMSCILLDDCLGSIKQHSIMNKVCSAVRHMKSIIIFSLQAVKGLPPSIRSCVTTSVIFYQPSAKQMKDLIEMHSAMGGEENFMQAYTKATSIPYGFLMCCWRDIAMYAAGGDRNEPELLWKLRDENGNISKGMESITKPMTE